MATVGRSTPRDSSSFYSSSNTLRTSSTPSSSPDVSRSSSSRSSSPGSSSSGSTPVSSRDSASTLQQVIAGLSACQRSIQDLLTSVESSNERIKDLSEKMKTLDDKVDKLSSEQTVDADRDRGNAEGKGKRKRTKSSLLIQEEVHKLHNSRDVPNQYKGRETVGSVHNRRVTQFIVNELSRRNGFSGVVVERTAKKYHEHIRRNALGKITDEVKKEKKKNLRKERKYERRKNSVKDERETRAFSSLNKHHMSTDDDDSDSDSAGWVSRPPKYRSETLVAFLKRLDKRSERAEGTGNKRWKRTETKTGHPVDREPPVNTPKWALCNDWIEELRRRDELLEQREQMERHAEAEEPEDSENDRASSGSRSEDENFDFDDE